MGVPDLNDVIIDAGEFPGPGSGTPGAPETNLLAYDDDLSKWTNIQASTLIAGISSIFLDDILDVEIATTALSDKDLLYYDDLSNLWVNGAASDANLYTITELDGGALNSLYYTQTELNTSGGGSIVHWDNLISVPSFAPASHSHYVYELFDVQDYSASPPSDGDTLIWDAVGGEWVPGPITSGFSAIINNSSVAGTYTGALDTSLTVSDINPLKFQAGDGIELTTDTTPSPA